MLMRGLFTIDNDYFLNGVYDPAVKWNGWTCPMFTYQVLTDYLNHVGEEDYVITPDYIKIADPCNEGCYDTYDVVEYKGNLYYPLGYMAWTWEVVETLPYQLLIEDHGLDGCTFTMYNLTSERAKYFIDVDKRNELIAYLSYSGLLTVSKEVSPDTHSYPDLLIPLSAVEDWEGVYFPA